METLQKISDGSLDDVYLSNFPTAICELNIKEEVRDESEEIINDFDYNADTDFKYEYENPCVKVESKELPDLNHQITPKSKEKKKKRRVSTKLKCELCAKTFTKINTLKEHEARFHNGPKPYKCVSCDSGFTTAKNLQNHIECVHEGKRPHACSSCDSKFYLPKDLKNHILSVHEKKKLHECPNCDFKADLKSNLKRHIVRAHEVNKLQYKCEFCGKGFLNNEKLKDHINIHTGEKPHLCKFCGAAFASYGTCRMHERMVHLGHKRK